MLFEQTPEIVHAIATFSELAIATSSVLIFDFANWKKKINTLQNDPIAVNDSILQARKMKRSQLYVYAIKASNMLEKIFSWIIRWAPRVSLLLATAALFGMSFYHQDLLVFFYLAFFAFCLALVSGWIEKSNSAIVENIDQAKSEIP